MEFCGVEKNETCWNVFLDSVWTEREGGVFKKMSEQVFDG